MPEISVFQRDIDLCAPASVCSLYQATNSTPIEQPFRSICVNIYLIP